MVNVIHIDNSNVSRVLLDNSSQVEVLPVSTFDKMGYSREQLREAA
jgi:chloramphenicol O-acetyltransferase